MTAHSELSEARWMLEEEPGLASQYTLPHRLPADKRTQPGNSGSCSAATVQLKIVPSLHPAH